MAERTSREMVHCYHINNEPHPELSSFEMLQHIFGFISSFQFPQQFLAISTIIHNSRGAPADPLAAAVQPEFERRQQAYVADHERWLTADQRAVYTEVATRMANGTGGAIFLQAPGGCGNILENLLLAKVRNERRVAVAASHLPAGR